MRPAFDVDSREDRAFILVKSWMFVVGGINFFPSGRELT